MKATTVGVLTNQGDGVYGSQYRVLNGEADGPVCVAAGDLDGNQYPDLAVVSWRSNDVAIILSDGDSYRPPVLYAVQASPWALTLGDFDW